MKVSIALECASSPQWIAAVMDDFEAFLQDHANCERKASAMAMSFVAKFPDRVEIIPELIEIGIEELEHFQSVYEIMKGRGVMLPAQMGKDDYVQQLVNQCRSGREERFLDRLLLASIVECRGAERFKLVYENLKDNELKVFYHQLWASESKHGNVFVSMALNYFDKNIVYSRLEELNHAEAKVLQSLPIRSALH
jgi:tRNA-(ms[2]io[6]A)-hydroxylase